MIDQIKYNWILIPMPPSLENPKIGVKLYARFSNALLGRLLTMTQNESWKFKWSPTGLVVDDTRQF